MIIINKMLKINCCTLLFTLLVSHFIHLLWNELTDDAFFISSGKLFHIRQPEYLRLCLKYSVFGLGGTKQQADDLKLTVILTSLRNVKFSEIYSGVDLLRVDLLRW